MLPQLHDVANYPIGMLVSSGFSVYLMTQSLESHNLDKINYFNGSSKVISHAFMYSKTILPTQDTGVLNYNSTYWSHNGVLILI